MNKCIICKVGSWIAGLSALAWGVAGWTFLADLIPLYAQIVLTAVALVGVGFLRYQWPFESCPRCT